MVEKFMPYQSLILDTETHSLHGFPIEIAYLPCTLDQNGLQRHETQIYDEYFSLEAGTNIHYASMAVHHIVPGDLANKPLYTEFRLPTDTTYIIGHNIDYDVAAIARCGQDVQQIKPICTLALARSIWNTLDSHNLSALSYYLSQDLTATREKLRNAHNAKTDVLITADLLEHIIQHLGVNSMEELFQASQRARLPQYMPFGKHKGTALIDVPHDYARWLLKQDNLEPYLREALEAIFS